MVRQFLLSGSVTCGLFAVAVIISQAGEPKAVDAPDLKPLHEKVRTLVEKYYPKAKVDLCGKTIRFESNTRKFMIHNPLKTGEWQDAHEEVGPQKSGIYCKIDLRNGDYDGQLAVPQALKGPYFTTHLLAPYSKRLDRHLYIYLKYPSDVSKDFLKEFFQLVNRFERQVTVNGK